MKKLLVITQTVDQNDQLLGFFVSWLRGLAERFDKMTVLCLDKGSFDLPGVRVISLGRDRGLPKIFWLLNFYKQIFRLRPDYDSVFVHMNPIWAVMGGLPWRMMRKKIILWYTHKAVTVKLRLAEKFAHVVLTASKKSFRLPSKKVVITGHGLDTELFKPDPAKRDENFKMLSVGRIAPVKNYEVLIDALKILKDRRFDFTLDIIGEPALEPDREYLEELKKKIEGLGLSKQINFLGLVNHDKLPLYYQSHHLFVHMSKTGSIDKTLLEAMSSGMSVVSSNDAARAFLAREFLFSEGNCEELADSIIKLSNREVGTELRQYVVDNHKLDELLDKIYSIE